MKTDASPLEERSDASVAAFLARQHRRFLAFLTPRVASQAVAEDILQAAYVKAIERGSQLRNGESAVAWFYRILRNAVVDHYRRTATRTAALEELKRQSSEAAPDPKLHDMVCECVRDVAATLKPAYAAIVNDVDVEGLSVEASARRAGISANNGSVRLHRARKALGMRLAQVCGVCATHRCVDCDCRRQDSEKS
jgi:RNA polymerase sigma-70 factor (ECF subfamily)